MLWHVIKTYDYFSMTTNCLVAQCCFPTTHITFGHECGTCHQYGHGQIECGKKDLLSDLSSRAHSVGCYMLPPDMRCTVDECDDQRFKHTLVSHKCYHCKQYGHGFAKCPTLGRIVKCPDCDVENVISLPGIYIAYAPICKICEKNSVSIRMPICGHVNMCTDCLINNSDYSDTDEGILSNTTSERWGDLITKIMGHTDGKIYVARYAGMGCFVFGRRRSVLDQIKYFFLHSDSQGQYGKNHGPYVDAFLFGYTEICDDVE